MTSFFSVIWRRLGSINLTIILCLLLALDLTYGYICLNRNAHIFTPINDLGLTDWIKTYGQYNLNHTMWLFILIILLTVLCINSFACTTDRLIRLFKSSGSLSGLRFILGLSPHIMHYAMIIILAGYLISYIFSTVLDTRVLIPGSSMTIPGTEIKLTFDSMSPEYYEGSIPSFEDRILKPNAKLFITEGNLSLDRLLNYNRPIMYKGYSIFLKSFRPNSKSSGMSSTQRIDLNIRTDPGVRFYMAGILLFVTGLLMYMADRFIYREAKRKSNAKN